MTKNKFKVIVIDDEKLAREIIIKHLSNFEELELIGECDNGFDAIKEINDKSPDLIFLDIQMPKVTGFELLEILDEPPLIIFSTAYDQFAIKAFEVNALDYLLKPYSKERFNEAVKKALHSLENKSLSVEKMKKLVETKDESHETINRIVVKKNNKIVIIPVDKIRFLEAQDDYVMLHTTEGKFLKQKTMKFFEKNLPEDNFVRIHRSYILNINYMKQIELYEKDSHKVILDDANKIPVSKSGYIRLKELLND